MREQRYLKIMKSSISNKIDIRHQENVEKVLTFRKTLSIESDRGCALMAASFLENEIESLLKTKLIGNNSLIKELFSFNGPLGTFSSKIKMAYSLGLISKYTMTDLNIIRRIRNSFGHEYKPISFETKEIKDQVNSIQYTMYKVGEARTRAIFTNTVMGHLSFITSQQLKENKFIEKAQELDEQKKKELINVVKNNMKDVIENYEKEFKSQSKYREFTVPSEGNEITEADVKSNQIRITADFKPFFPSESAKLKVIIKNEYECIFTHRGDRSHVLRLGKDACAELGLKAADSVKFTEVGKNEYKLELA